MNKVISGEPKILCPHCKAEYLPSEIYDPDTFFGNPRIIDRDSKSKIVMFTGSGMNLEETFICDFCDTEFTILSKIEFVTTEVKQHCFSEDFVTKIK